MARARRTGKTAAKAASRVLRTSRSRDAKKAAGSALSQAAPKPRKKK